MLTRKITRELQAWKARPGHKSLIIRGARQVGKTRSVRAFGADEYRHVIELNFEEHPEYVSIFAGARAATDIAMQLSLFFPDAVADPEGTLLFLDEIQSCPDAITALKFLTQDSPMDVIATGSLLGISYRAVSSFPVGYVDHLEMHALDFEEFLWARGVGEGSVDYVRGFYERREKVPEAVNSRMLALFRDYIVIGGMPEAVQTFLDTGNYGEVLRVQRDILTEYRNDIAKYADGTEKAKARACFDSIPRQLSRDSKKFTYSLVEKGGTRRKFGGSLEWLHDAGIITFCHCLNAIQLPLEGNVDDARFKVYMADTGLLVAMLEDGSQKDILDGNLGIYKGAIYENIVGDILAKAGRPLYYYERNNRLEIDFVIRYDGEATPVEVKSSLNRKAKSMETLIASGVARHGIKLAPGNYGRIGEAIEVMPLYMAMFL